MLEQVIRLRIDMTVNEGKIETFQSIAREMTEASGSEHGTLGYEWFAAKDGKTFRLLETYVDAAAFEKHFLGAVVQKLLPRLAAVCTVDALEIYGDPGSKVAALAAGQGARIFDYALGLGR
jgi:quinol monooxygenase YgiN